MRQDYELRAPRRTCQNYDIRGKKVYAPPVVMGMKGARSQGAFRRFCRLVGCYEESFWRRPPR